jgi:hypothetical protein
MVGKVNVAPRQLRLIAASIVTCPLLTIGDLAHAVPARAAGWGDFCAKSIPSHKQKIERGALAGYAAQGTRRDYFPRQTTRSQVRKMAQLERPRSMPENTLCKATHNQAV